MVVIRNRTHCLRQVCVTNQCRGMLFNLTELSDYDGSDMEKKFAPLADINNWTIFPSVDASLETYEGSNLWNSNVSDWGSMTNGSRNASMPSAPRYVMHWGQQFAWATVFIAMLFVATVGNSLVAWIVLAHRRMRSVTNYFLVNLSVADLTMSLFNCAFNFVFMLNSHWPFGSFYCTVNNFIANVTVAASVFTLMAISFDRYVAIVKPLQPRISKCVARIVLAVIWLASMALATPCLLYSRTLSIQYTNGQIRTLCLIQWPDGLASQSFQDYIYNILFLILTYLLPMTAMAVCYSRMSCVLWGSQAIGELSQRQLSTIQSKRKVVRMFTVIVTLFAVCWLPYHSYFIYTYHNTQIMTSDYIQHVYLMFYWFAMSNAMVNPIVYYWMNARFRQYFKSVIFHCLCCRKRGRRMENDSPPMLRRSLPGSSSHARTGGIRMLDAGKMVAQQATAGVSRSRPESEGSSHSHEGHQRCLVFVKSLEAHANGISKSYPGVEMTCWCNPGTLRLVSLSQTWNDDVLATHHSVHITRTIIHAKDLNGNRSLPMEFSLQTV